MRHRKIERAGMPREVREKLFDPFFTTKSGLGGTGLGLATVSTIVARWGGGMRVESTVGEGSVFFIEFPWTTDVRRDDKGPELIAPANGEGLLVVDLLGGRTR